MVVRVESFCGCMSLKCGALFIGILGLIVSTSVGVYGGFIASQSSHFLTSSIIYITSGGK